MAAVLCLSIGVGFAAAMYTQVQSTVFREIPGVQNAGGLVRLQMPVAAANYEDLRRQTGVFSSSAAFLGPVPLVLSAKGSTPVRIWGHIATTDYFGALGAKAAVGRVFDAERRVRGGAPVAAIGHNLWQLRFGGDPGIVGLRIRINGQPAEIVGVA